MKKYFLLSLLLVFSGCAVQQGCPPNTLLENKQCVQIHGQELATVYSVTCVPLKCEMYDVEIVLENGEHISFQSTHKFVEGEVIEVNYK